MDEQEVPVKVNISISGIPDHEEVKNSFVIKHEVLLF